MPDAYAGRMPDAPPTHMPDALRVGNAGSNARTYGRTDEDFGYGRDQSSRPVPSAHEADLASIGPGSAGQPTPKTGPILRRGTCRYCHHPVVWGRLLSGHHRSFVPELVPASYLAEADRYAVHLRHRAVVDLTGVTNPPRLVLTVHRCPQYADALRMRNLTQLGATADALTDLWRPA